jgi:HlyD family secretion protein/epimerase transport system membrane fusion protein
MTNSESSKEPGEAPPVDRWIALGLVISVVMFGGFGSWAALAPLSSASMAPGIVKVDSNRKTVQHYEGGIIREILVRDGDQVSQGQVLVRLDGVDARADFDALQGQLDALRAREARLIAQRDGLDVIPLPDNLLARSTEREVTMIVDGQQRIFDDQAQALDAEVAVLSQRVQRFKAQIAAYEAENNSLSQQLVTLEEEHAAAAELLASGFERRSRVLELQRRVSAARGEIAANEQRIVAVNEEIAEAHLQITSLREARAQAVSEELRDVQTQAAELEHRMDKSDAQVGRKDLVAPQAGVVVNSRYFTAGGVITPGAEVMDIVPAKDRLVVEARVRPLDIDVVRIGLPAAVRLVAFKQRSTPTLNGTVRRISADALSDERTGETYYLASVEVPLEELSRLPDVELYPGMPVDVAIVTGEHTLFAYLAQPFTDSLAQAFRED